MTALDRDLDIHDPLGKQVPSRVIARINFRAALSHLAAVAVAFAIGISAFILFTRNNDFPTNYHIDEPGKVRQLHDPYGRRNFNHPLLMLEAAGLAAQWMNSSGDHFATAIAGRSASAIIAAVGVAAAGVAGYVLYGWAGLFILGGAIALCPPLQVYAHYLKEDATLGGSILFTLMAAAMVITSRRYWTRVASIIFLGMGVGLTFSAKYAGAMIFVPALLALLIAPGWRWWSLPARLAPFVLSGVMTIAFINQRAFDNIWTLQLSHEAKTGIERETTHGTTEHNGLTMDMPHTYFLRIANSELMLHLKILAGAALIYLLWKRKFSRWGIASILFLATFAVALAYCPIPFGRYAFPITLTAYFLCAAAIASAIAAIQPVRRQLIVAAVALLCIGIFQGIQCVKVNDQFVNDSRHLLRQWVAENIPPGSRMIIDRYAQLHNPGDTYRFPDQKDPKAYITQQSSASDMGSLDELRRHGFDYIVVCQLMYGRYEVPEARGMPGPPAVSFDFRRKFYQDVFALGEPLWQYTPDPVTNSNLSPEIRLYKLTPSAQPPRAMSN